MRVPIATEDEVGNEGRLLSAASGFVDVQEVSTIEVVTFSGVTSGGIVTSGTTCCTWDQQGDLSETGRSNETA